MKSVVYMVCDPREKLSVNLGENTSWYHSCHWTMSTKSHW